MPKTLAFVQVDVFTDTPLQGNPLAVFLDAAGLDASQMQAIAREMNLSETTFIFAPEDSESDARVRIFTPRSEIPFAGHPTIGTAYVLAQRSGSDRIRLHENAGIIEVRREADGRFFFTLPPPKLLQRFEDATAIARALALDPAQALREMPVQAAGAGGTAFLYVPLQDATAVDAAVLDVRAMREAAGEFSDGVFIFAPHGSNHVYSRMFAPAHGVAEDPATVSASGPLAMLLRNAGLIAGGDPIEAMSEQGVQMGRRSVIALRSYADGRFEIGGHVAPVLSGELTQ